MRWPRLPRPCGMRGTRRGQCRLAELASGVTHSEVCQRGSKPTRAIRAAVQWRAKRVAVGNPDLAGQPRLDGTGHGRLGHDDEPAAKRRRATARRLPFLPRRGRHRRRRRQAAFTGSNT